MKLWLCLRFYRLPLESLNRDEDQPVAVLAAQRVVCANDCAAALGIRPGMGTATVRALAGDLPVRLLERDPAAEVRCLEQLCCWAYGITPALRRWRDDSLALEIGGCLALFRGLDTLLATVADGIRQRGYRAQPGLAPTPDAAWLLSFAGGDTARDITRDISQNIFQDIARPLPERLAPLPISLLEDFAGQVADLRRAGLHTVGDLLALPPAALARRCGADFSRGLRQLLGEAVDGARQVKSGRQVKPGKAGARTAGPRTTAQAQDGSTAQANYQPPAEFRDEHWFGYGVHSNTELLPAMQPLLQSLCAFLRNAQLRTGEIHWQLIGVDRRLREVSVRSASHHSDWRQWLQLTRLRLEQLQLPGSVEGLALHCTQLQPGEPDNLDLFCPRRQREPLAALPDRLRNRLGPQAVAQLGCRDEHLPELALRLDGDHPGDTPAPAAQAQRPFWLLAQPQPLPTRGGQLHWQGPLRLHHGPERIEDGWWRNAASRDYYIATGGGGQPYWVFRDRRGGGWYLHGVFV